MHLSTLGVIGRCENSAGLECLCGNRLSDRCFRGGTEESVALLHQLRLPLVWHTPLGTGGRVRLLVVVPKEGLEYRPVQVPPSIAFGTVKGQQ